MPDDYLKALNELNDSMKRIEGRRNLFKAEKIKLLQEEDRLYAMKELASKTAKDARPGKAKNKPQK
jgi:hypothetical protein